MHRGDRGARARGPRGGGARPTARYGGSRLRAERVPLPRGADGERAGLGGGARSRARDAGSGPGHGRVLPSNRSVLGGEGKMLRESHKIHADSLLRLRAGWEGEFIFQGLFSAVSESQSESR